MAVNEPVSGTTRSTKPDDRGSTTIGASTRWRLLAGISIVIMLAGGYWLLAKTGALEMFSHSSALREQVAQLGALGPLAVVGLMVIAVVIGPIPSAPIALAAGAAYGHTWGTLYVLIGSEGGALAAFGIARLLGCELLPKLCASRESLRLFGSQTTLMGIVFVSRLIPLISFDVVSYAAGLTALSTWRFALATLAGILPASFLLAHFGSELASAETERIAFTVLALGLLTAVPVLGRVIWLRLKARSSRRAGR